ncbi:MULTISPECIES: NADH-quinone oxidoreductase subunit K [Micrococcus]|uniref:NADH-quinone oxidoreductase subunit K n=1 Tax=Micrococcus TaxID=1269 RepID=UPI0007656AF9|nr:MULTISPECIES: NADH-quinone oxidoreductase subunit K [Micrococcus]CVM56006.1 Multiple resistance and pH homeostasis protein C [Streptococcus pneumoniae]MBE1539558.1 multicomponent Na+:H+ antiporter subunit C [Micrococcus yunnanensis]MCV7529899.1 NADH-quinone oxidoreductase subunit K [Micrococcus luteus]MCV7538106.1 NADH-quinone oxidoreductase subunit K [Micrococcus luteus]MCV7684810.1 NADH-quinone oxidoreductase subunit K [Micrococcus luteus]
MMTVDLALLLAMGVMFAGGIYLVLERSLTRILLGIMLINNGAIMLLFLASGGVGLAPLFVRGRDPHEYADTLPQALILTAIVIGFAVVAFLTAMIYRSWLLIREDEVEVDAEDVKIARMPAWDAEDDAELVEESSEFLDDAADPNAHYEHATESRPHVRHASPTSPTHPGPASAVRAHRADGGPRP